MLVMAVVAVLAVATVPRLQETSRRLRAEQVAGELMQLMRAAREQAIGGQVETLWAWDAGARRSSVRPVPPAGAPGEEPQQAPAGDLITGSKAPDGTDVAITRDGETIECRCLRFFPDGTSESATLQVELYDHVLTATLDETTGQASLRAGAALN
jgi:type II secretory pathway pseudopilin PulG